MPDRYGTRPMLRSSHSCGWRGRQTHFMVGGADRLPGLLGRLGAPFGTYCRDGPSLSDLAAPEAERNLPAGGYDGYLPSTCRLLLRGVGPGNPLPGREAPVPAYDVAQAEYPGALSQGHDVFAADHGHPARPELLPSIRRTGTGGNSIGVTTHPGEVTFVKNAASSSLPF